MVWRKWWVLVSRSGIFNLWSKTKRGWIGFL